MRKFSWSFFAVGVAFFVFAAPSAEAKTLFYDGFESPSSESQWEMNGLWHRQTNPEEISISEDINPDLVELPDREGSLPAAKNGKNVMWFGSEEDGTFLNEWNLSDQTSGNGGTSVAAHEGELISPEIALTKGEDATLSFWNWWEIEGVDVDRYDLMSVDIRTSRDGDWEELLSLNPINDADGEAFKPYTNQGLNEPGAWVKTDLDISEYDGETVQIRFYFKTVDQKYNGFRGLLIDNVRVTNTLPKKAKARAIIKGAKQYCGGGVKNGAVTKPIHFALQDEERITVRGRRGRWFITPYGSDTRILVKSKRRKAVYLNEGHYTLWVNFKKDKECPKTKRVTASVRTQPAVSQRNIRANQFLNINGDGFTAKSTVEFRKDGAKKKIAAKAVRVLGSQLIQVRTPSLPSAGQYDIIVTTPSGKARTFAKVVRFTKNQRPVITSYSPKLAADNSTTKVTINGKRFDEDAVVTVGGLPLLDVTVTRSRKITGTLPQGGAPGFHNLVVMNPDGQRAVRFGAVRISDKTRDGYKPAGDLHLAPSRVSGVEATAGAKSVTVSWDAVDNTTVDHYTVYIKKGDETVKTREVTDTEVTVEGLGAATDYTVVVRAVSTYRGGKVSSRVSFTTD